MRALLDTHTFIWWVTNDPRLSKRSREIIANEKNDILLSAISGWEMAIKAGLGKVSVSSSVADFVLDQAATCHFTLLPFSMHHALRVHILPDHHKDPFDRALVAQAQVENLAILTADPQIARYAITALW